MVKFQCFKSSLTERMKWKGERLGRKRNKEKKNTKFHYVLEWLENDGIIITNK